VVAGRWRPFADGYKRKLVALGHKPTTVRQHLRLMGQLSGWLAGEGLGAGDLTRARAEVFLDARRTGGQRPPATMASMAKLLDDLIEQRVVRAELPAVASPRDVLVDEYRRHLIHDRGLSASTVSRYARFAKQFLSQRASRIGTALGVEGLSSAEVNAYLLLASSRLVVDSAKREAADLRALLRFLYLSFPRFSGDFPTRFDFANRERKSWERGSIRSSCVSVRCGCIGSRIRSR
jgi:integrase/recombinase XerD